MHFSSGIANRAFYLATAGLNNKDNNGSLPAAIGALLRVADGKRAGVPYSRAPVPGEQPFAPCWQRWASRCRPEA